MVAARDRDLPAPIVRDAKHRILDTIGAMVSGAVLPPGVMATRYVRAQGGTAEASVLTTDIRTTAVNAALANGMFAHADETDDFEPVTKAHPGSAVVPAALAMAEREGRSGTELIRAVVLGYDLCCRFLMALGPDHVRATHRSAEGTSATFGAVGAAASLARLDEKGMRFALSYAAQQVSGLWSWTRDEDHVEKAFDFAGMGARNGVTAATMVQAGFTGVSDVLDGEHNMILALSREGKPEEMVAGLGSRFFVTETAIKLFSVGYPIQAPLDALLALRTASTGCVPTTSTRIVVRLPEDGARIVDNSAMPDVNCQHLMAVALIDGTVSFETSHSRERMAGSGGAGGARARAARGRQVADGSGGAAQRKSRGDAGRRPNGEPLHQARAGHEGESARRGAFEREGRRPHCAGPRCAPGRGCHRSRERARERQRRSRVGCVDDQAGLKLANTSTPNLQFPTSKQLEVSIVEIRLGIGSWELELTLIHSSVFPRRIRCDR